MTVFTSTILGSRLLAITKPRAIWLFLLILISLNACHKSVPDESSGKSGIDTTRSELSVPGVTITQKVQELEGIHVIHPDSGTYRKHLEAYGVVLSPERLISLQNQFVSKTQQVRRCKAQLLVTHREYQRQDTLYRQKGTSQEDLQVARSKWISDQADLAESQQDLRALIDSSRQFWGSVVTRWIQNNTDPIQRIIKQRAWMIRVTPAGPLPGSINNLPKTVAMGITRQHMFPGRFVSRSPSLDTRFQQAGYFYLVDKPPVDLSPDMNLVVEFPVGKPHQAILIPDSAVTWWQGTPWIYLKSGPRQFNRYSLLGAISAGSHWYVTRQEIPIHHGDELVVSGVQFLLEKELQGAKPTVSAGDEGDDD